MQIFVESCGGRNFLSLIIHNFFIYIESCQCRKYEKKKKNHFLFFSFIVLSLDYGVQTAQFTQLHFHPTRLTAGFKHSLYVKMANIYICWTKLLVHLIIKPL